MKKVIALLWLMALCGSACAMQYPELGVCTGDKVRLREDPGTEGQVIGRADVGTQFIVLGEVYVDGQKWYEIDHPTKEGSAYIIARYVNGWYNNGEYPVGEVCAGVRLTFCINPQKTRELLGRPTKTAREDSDEILEYPGLKLWYNEGSLSRAEISGKGYAVGGIQVGDKVGKLMNLEMSEDARSILEDIIHDLHDIASEEHDDDEAVDGPEGWSMTSASGEEIFFQFGTDSKGEFIVDWMSWYRPLGEG